MTKDPHKISLLPGYKWARYFRLQMAVKQTAQNRARLAQGLRQVGRPMPRLVSIDFEDAYMVPTEWTAQDAIDFGNQSVVPYFAVFDGEYHVIPNSEVPASVTQACLDAGKILVLPMEGIYKW